MKMRDGVDRKVVAYYPLHYGVEWLAWSMRSIVDIVDEIVVVYTDKPSYGYKTLQQCPETESDLIASAMRFMDLTNWFTREFNSETAHRQHALDICRVHGADIVLAIDADEIWNEQHLVNALNYVDTHDSTYYRVPMQHYWRSVGKVCRDDALPHRFTKLNLSDYLTPRYDNIPFHMGYVHHFGYAQSPRIMKYKWLIHGHKAELRKNWMEEKFDAFAIMDVHPTNMNYWTAAASNLEVLEPLIGDHPYWGMDMIDDSIAVPTKLMITEPSVDTFILSGDGNYV